MMAHRSEIASKQLSLLRELIGEIKNRNPFYTERLSLSGIMENIVSLTDFSKRMSFTTKMDLVWDREENPPYGSNLTYPLAKYTRFCQSSGTTRGPMAWLDTQESWAAMLDCWDEVYSAAAVEPGQRIFFAFSFGPFLGFWTAYDAAVRRGNLSIPGGGLSSRARLKTMAAHQCQVLCCTPTYALRLGEVLEANRDDEDLASLAIQTIIVAGERGGSIPEVREQISRLWNRARVFDHHGMTEVGPVTFEPLGAPLSLCVIEDAYYAEVIDRETHLEVAPGERGELVLTTLRRSACPLLRYRTGDLVEKSYHEGCLCFRGGILGRADEMVVIRGVNIYPTAVEKVIRSFPEIAEFQVLETTRDSMAELEITLDPRPEVKDPQALARTVENALQDAFTLRIPVSCADPGDLPRFEFKSKRWIKKEQA